MLFIVQDACHFAVPQQPVNTNKTTRELVLQTLPFQYLRKSIPLYFEAAAAKANDDRGGRRAVIIYQN